MALSVVRAWVGMVLAGVVLAWCPCTFALNPALDVSQYAHTAWKVREGFSRGYITSIAQTPDGYLWLGTEFGLLRFDGVRNVPWQPPGDEHLPGNYIWSLLVARDGTLWIGTTKGLASWKDGKLAQYPALAEQGVSTLLEDREGTVWAGGFTVPTGRLCKIRGASIQCYGEDGSLGHGVLSLYEDSGGYLWAGGLTGLWRWKPGPTKFYSTPNLGNGVQSLIEGDNGALLIAVDGGIKQLVDGKAEAYSLPGTVPQLKPKRFLRDRDGGMWIGTQDHGLLHVHQGRTDVFGQPEGLSGDNVAKLFEDREGNLWVATEDGLDRFRAFAVSTISVKQSLSNPVVGSVVAARDGSVWLGTNNGLNRWKDGQITIYRKLSAQAGGSDTRRELNVRDITDNGLPDDAVESLGQDDRGRIWVSTRRGVTYFENGRFVSVGGVPSGNVRSIAGERAGNLWISDRKNGLFHLFEESVVEWIPWARLGRKGPLR
jgi:ligand-binding sensor domain-containing protein